MALAAAMLAGSVWAQDYNPPPPVTNLQADPGRHSVTLSFTAPGDACTHAACAEYDIRYSAIPMTNENFSGQTPIAKGVPSAPGTPECFDSATLQPPDSTVLICGVTYYVGIKVKDQAGNWSPMAQVQFTTLPCCPPLQVCARPFCADGGFPVSPLPSGAFDDIKPNAMTTLNATTGRTTATLSFIAPVDDNTNTACAEYDIRYSTQALNDCNFTQGVRVTGPTPASPGTPQQAAISGLSCNTTYYFAMKVRDAAGNWALISNVVTRATLNRDPIRNDYDGDRKADLQVLIAEGGGWAWKVDYQADGLKTTSSAGSPAYNYRVTGIPGSPTEVLPLPQDYDGDGRADVGFLIRTGSASQWKVRYTDSASEVVYPSGFQDLITSADHTALNNWVGAAAGDFDGDCKIDLLVVDGAGTARIDLAANGFITWDVTAPGVGVSDGVYMARDVDGDDVNELMVSDYTGAWKIYKLNGSLLGLIYTRAAVPADYGWYATAEDFDGNGCVDLCLMLESGAQWKIAYATCNPAGLYGAWTDYNAIGPPDFGWQPQPADYDGDGRADLGYRHALTGTWRVDFSANGFTGYNPPQYFRYGDADDVGIYRAKPETQEPSPEKLAIACQPNPGEGVTSLMFAHPTGGYVDLALFDLLGRRVRTLARGALPSGRHTVQWDGRDASGRPVAPGVYLAVITAGGATARTRIVIVP